MKYKRKKTTKLFFYIILVAFHCVFYANATNWYVDNAATGANDGTSWTDAWQSFADIQWTSIQPGDIIFISGGINEKAYYEQLSIDADGAEGSPIIIRVGQDQGHNGNVILTDTVNDNGGILIIYQNYITIDGNVNGQKHLTIQDCAGVGINTYGAQGIKLTYLYVYRNGGQHDWNNSGMTLRIMEYNDEYKPNIEVSYCHIDNNWQDAFSVFGPIADDFGYISIHHNEISNVVDDGMECNAGGVDFYNNHMHDRSYDGGDGHPDGIAFNGSEYYRVYNNIFHGFRCGTAYINYEPFYNTTPPSPRPGDHVYIYNNLIYEDEIVPLGFIPSHHTFRINNPYRSGRPDGIYTDIDDARVLFSHLKDQGYIGVDSYITDTFRNLTDSSQIELDSIYENQKEEIYNIIISYEDVGSSLGGISFGGSDVTTTYLHDIIIANNTMVNLPAGGFGIGCNNHGSENLNNIIIANNIAHNCYTNGGGTASSVGGIADESLIGSSGSGAIIIYDNNIISEGENGCNFMRYTEYFMDYNDFVTTYQLNINGANIDPSLSVEYKPDNENDPTVDAGLDLSAYFSTDIEGAPRPQGSGWDIGAFEYTTGSNILSASTENKENFRIYPNPFRTQTTIEYKLSEKSEIEILLYEINGRLVKTIYSGLESKGLHSIELNGRDLLPGIYFIKLINKNFTETKKCLII